MSGLGGKRGPLKPVPTKRSLLALFFLLVLPLGSLIVCVPLVLVRGHRLDEHLFSYWIVVTPMLLAITFGDILGRRVAGAIGYHWSHLAGRLAEASVGFAAFGAFGVLGTFVHPQGWAIGLIGGVIFLVLGVSGFITSLRGR